MPFSFCELSLSITLRLGHLRLIPAAVLFRAEYRQPEPFHVMTGLRVAVFHLPLKEICQHLLVSFLWMSLNSLTSHGKDGTRLKAD